MRISLAGLELKCISFVGTMRGKDDNCKATIQLKSMNNVASFNKPTY
jgi:hypothetical protein